jgi:signal transduction histidine kinase
VVVGWQADPPWTVLEVVDGGPGFSPDALERAFSPFFTTKPDGTGLGLTIAKRVVEGHEGRVEVRNMDGGGGCVVIRLPLAV